MKKLALLIVFLLTLGLTATFAELGVEPSVSGNVTLTWGMDLNGPEATHGFQSASDLTMELRLVEGYSTEKGAEEKVYGWIEAKNINFYLLNSQGGTADFSFPADTVAEVTARIILGPTAYLEIFNTATEVKFDYAAIIDRHNYQIDWSTFAQEQQGVLSALQVETLRDATDTMPGVTVGLAFDPVSLKLYLLDTSNDTWSHTGTATPGDAMYFLGASANAGFGPATVDVYGGYYLDLSSAAVKTPIPFGAKAKLDLAFGGGMGVENTVGFDGLYDGVASTLDYELADTLVFGLTENADGAIATKIEAKVSMADALTLGDTDLKVTFSESEADGFIPWLSASVYYQMEDITAGGFDTGSKLGGSLAYKVMLDDVNYIKPSVSFNYDMGINATTNDEIADLTISAEAVLIPNTTFTLKYASKQLLDGMTALDVDPNPATEAFVDTRITDKGAVTFETKISF